MSRQFCYFIRLKIKSISKKYLKSNRWNGSGRVHHGKKALNVQKFNRKNKSLYYSRFIRICGSLVILYMCEPENGRTG